MPKMKKFALSIHPAKHGFYGGIEIDLGMLNDSPQKVVASENLDALTGEVEKFANEYKFGCIIFVKCLEKRKPNGFDARMRGLYFNLDVQPADVAA